jgi:hypothetical protein
MKRDADAPRHVPSFITATGQGRRVVALAVVVVAMAVRWLVELPIDGLWAPLFDVFGLCALFWVVASIRCPRCACRVVWHAMSTESFRSWGEVFSWATCPVCGLCPGGNAAGAAASVAAALDAVASGDESASNAMSQWPAMRDRLLDAAWHELSHFENDADTRRRDDAYDRYQRDSLRELAWQIRDRFGVG